MFQHIASEFHNKFKIISINICSLNAKFTLLTAFLQSFSFKYDIIVLIETFLTESTTSLYEIEGYNHDFIFRKKRKGGGISIFSRNDIQLNVYEPLCEVTPTHEQLIAKVSIPDSISFTLIALYRMPNNPISTFNEHIKQNLFPKFKKSEKIICIGDFNVNLINLNSLKPQENEFINIMKENGFTMQITGEPTRYPSKTLLDNCFVNFERGSSSCVINFPISDHLPVLFTFHAKTPKQLTKIKFRDFSDAKTNQFLSVKDNIFNSYNIDSNNASQEVDKFVNFLWSITNRYFPFKEKTISTKKLKMPWASNVWPLVNKKHKLFICLKRG